MSDKVIDLAAKRRARDGESVGALTVSVTRHGISLLIGSETEGAEAWLSVEDAERHIASVQRAIKAARSAAVKSGQLTTEEPG